MDFLRYQVGEINALEMLRQAKSWKESKRVHSLINDN